MTTISTQEASDNKGALIHVSELTGGLVEFNEFAEKMLDFKQHYDGVVYDLTVPAIEKQARSDRYAIGVVVSSLDKRHAELKKPILEKGSRLDAARRRIKEELQTIQQSIKDQLAVHEKKIAAHEAELQAKVDAILDLTIFDAEANVPNIQAAIDKAYDIEVDDSYEERKEDALNAQIHVIDELENKLAQRKAQDVRDAELERLRKEKEERDEREAKEKTEAEAKFKAEEDRRIAAEEEAAKQKLMAEAAQQAAEKKIADAKAEQDRRIAAEKREEEDRIADEEHRIQIREEIKSDLMETHKLSVTAANKTLKALIAGVRHITINY